MANTNIYMLCDPDTDEPRYIGKADCIKTRYAQHLRNARVGMKTHKYNWIKSLQEQNKLPKLELLEEISIDVWQEAERYYIQEYRKLGARLTNIDDGGLGGRSGKKLGKLHLIRKKLSHMYINSKKSGDYRLMNHVATKLVNICKTRPELASKSWFGIQLP
jgi:hypothetical protein